MIMSLMLITSSTYCSLVSREDHEMRLQSQNKELHFRQFSALAVGAFKTHNYESANDYICAASQCVTSELEQQLVDQIRLCIHIVTLQEQIDGKRPLEVSLNCAPNKRSKRTESEILLK